MTEFQPISFQNDKFIFIDQTKLPLKEEYIETESYERIAEAIERLEVRGAPAIGIAAGYALALSIKKKSSDDIFNDAYNRLARTRPTAVNLFWALNEIKLQYNKNIHSDNLYGILKSRALEIHQDDIDKCRNIGLNGLQIFKKKSTVLTHCNAGALATGGEGTAFNVIKTGFENGLVSYVYSDETRPLLQGSRLTAFELEKAGIPFSINTDSSAAFLMQHGKIDLVVTGADRIAKNGDTANKIGTYSLAVLCNYHKIPFYIAAPTSTIDCNCITGKEIKIELRDKKEVIQVNGNPITRDTYDVYSPAFDVTPSELIAGIITENTIYKSPYNF